MNDSQGTNRTALITGASKGIGRATALRLASQGIKVAVNYNSSPDSAAEVVAEITRNGGNALAVHADVSDSDQVGCMVDKIEDIWGKVDILVNNAGIINDKLLLRMSNEDWHRVIDVNLNGTFYCTRSVLRKMVGSRWGRIINIASIVGLRGNPSQTNYTASKAAVIGFTKALAKEVATRNITVNCITPGYFDTETTSVLSDRQKEHWNSLIPQGHFGEVDDVANLVAFLAGESSKYITGQVVSVDGGLAV